ncbi:ketopantoate reductase family protein [Mucilaginibacter segetis]|uniref:2-dehydropantoate 2-reductase n=1 Tax=Mucilaginibacter segetis TaxID=2793071 RepID=A0A934PTM0_9SPHI|nr:ketopantoate reductase C-terminal domain-containing protein [Mucilaginibacter segetis]MBK0379352.1 ketopantoate reductase [Mucilaginibacter segetis]
MPSINKIYIVGAGAIGQALAVCLQHAGRAVTLVRRAGTGPMRIKVQAHQLLEATVPVIRIEEIGEGLVLVTAKSFANPGIAAKLAGQTVVLLQNGLNIEKDFDNRELYRCVLMVTSQFDTNGVVQFKPVSPCPTGAVRGGQLPQVVAALDNPWFRFIAAENIQELVWRKVIVNCVFNAICPLLETDNGIFHRDESARAIARRVITECMAVAQQFVTLELETVMDSLLNISRLSDGQYISTLQDIRQGRPTELDTLNAEIVRLAGDLPVTETRLLGELAMLKSLQGAGAG